MHVPYILYFIILKKALLLNKTNINILKSIELLLLFLCYCSHTYDSYIFNVIQKKVQDLHLSILEREEKLRGSIK